MFFSSFCSLFFRLFSDGYCLITTRYHHYILQFTAFHSVFGCVFFHAYANWLQGNEKGIDFRNQRGNTENGIGQPDEVFIPPNLIPKPDFTVNDPEQEFPNLVPSSREYQLPAGKRRMATAVSAGMGMRTKSGSLDENEFPTLAKMHAPPTSSSRPESPRGRRRSPQPPPPQRKPIGLTMRDQNEFPMLPGMDVYAEIAPIERPKEDLPSDGGRPVSPNAEVSPRNSPSPPPPRPMVPAPADVAGKSFMEILGVSKEKQIGRGLWEEKSQKRPDTGKIASDDFPTLVPTQTSKNGALWGSRQNAKAGAWAGSSSGSGVRPGEGRSKVNPMPEPIDFGIEVIKKPKMKKMKQRKVDEKGDGSPVSEKNRNEKIKNDRQIIENFAKLEEHKRPEKREVEDFPQLPASQPSVSIPDQKVASSSDSKPRTADTWDANAQDVPSKSAHDFPDLPGAPEKSSISDAIDRRAAVIAQKMQRSSPVPDSWDSVIKTERPPTPPTQTRPSPPDLTSDFPDLQPSVRPRPTTSDKSKKKTAKKPEPVQPEPESRRHLDYPDLKSVGSSLVAPQQVHKGVSDVLRSGISQGPPPGFTPPPGLAEPPPGLPNGLIDGPDSLDLLSPVVLEQTPDSLDLLPPELLQPLPINGHVHPPGLGLEQNSPPGLGRVQKRRSSGELGPYTPLDNASKRNHELYVRIEQELPYERLVDFKTLSGKFRSGGLKAKKFYAAMKSMFPKEAFAAVFPELVALLPDIQKQHELRDLDYNVHCKSLKACDTCLQLVPGRDMNAHRAKH